MPLPLPLISAGIGAATGLGKTIAGAFKTGNANREIARLEANSPTYSRPDEIKQYLEMAKSNAYSEMPGSDLINQNIQQTNQSMVSNLQESGQLDPDAVQKLYQSQVGAVNNLALQQAQYFRGQQGRLSEALKTSAQYADQEFQHNIQDPFERKYNRAIGKYEAGQSMVGSGLNTIANSALSYLGSQNPVPGANDPSLTKY